MKGQSLIEVVVALGIIAVIATGVATIVTSAINSAQFSKDQQTATKYAQEGLEIARSIRNSSYASFASYNGTYCLAKNTDSLGQVVPSCTVPNADKFIRSIQIESNSVDCGANVSKVTATVSWSDGKCQSNTQCHKSELDTCLSNVNPIPGI